MRARPAAAVLLLALAAAPAAAMEMRAVGSQLILTGRVVAGDAAAFRRLLTPAIDTVILKDSPGGDAPAGYAIGELIRARGLRTAVSGYCASSCSRMYLGGVSRHFTDDQPAGRTYVGFHGHYKADGTLDAALVARLGLRDWTLRHLGPGADPALVARWVALPSARGLVLFFDSERLGRADGASVFACAGHEPGLDACEKLLGRTAYSLGVATSAEIVGVNRE